MCNSLTVHYQVNGEDVQGLSHARVIGMLRKITGTVELEIRRYGPHFIKDIYQSVECNKIFKFCHCLYHIETRKENQLQSNKWKDLCSKLSLSLPYM